MKVGLAIPQPHILSITTIAACILDNELNFILTCHEAEHAQLTNVEKWLGGRTLHQLALLSKPQREP